MNGSRGSSDRHRTAPLLGAACWHRSRTHPGERDPPTKAGTRRGKARLPSKTTAWKSDGEGEGDGAEVRAERCSEIPKHNVKRRTTPNMGKTWWHSQNAGGSGELDTEKSAWLVLRCCKTRSQACLPPAPDANLETTKFPNASMGMMGLFSSF